MALPENDLPKVLELALEKGAVQKTEELARKEGFSEPETHALEAVAFFARARQYDEAAKSAIGITGFFRRLQFAHKAKVARIEGQRQYTEALREDRDTTRRVISTPR